MALSYLDPIVFFLTEEQWLNQTKVGFNRSLVPVQTVNTAACYIYDKHISKDYFVSY